MSEYTDRAVSRIREAARLPFGSSGSQSAYAEAHALAATSTAIDLAELAALMRAPVVVHDADFTDEQRAAYGAATGAKLDADLASYAEGTSLSESAQAAIENIIELDREEDDMTVVVYGPTTSTTARLDAAAQMLNVNRKALGMWLTEMFDGRPADDDDEDDEPIHIDDVLDDKLDDDDTAYLDITPVVPDIFAEAKGADKPPAAPKAKKKGGKK